MIACSLSLHSCHTEDFQDEISRQSTEKGKLKAFEDFEKRIHTSLSAREGAEDSYAYPFAETLYQVFEKNPEYKKSFEEVFGEVDFGVASQTFGEAEKLVYFPILKNGKLNYILSCAINEKRTDAYYKILEPGEVKEYEIVTNTFVNYYGTISNPTARNEPTYYVDEIVITWNDPIPWWWYMTYGGANTPVPFPGPTGGSVSVPNPQTHPIGGINNGISPCEKTKALISKPQITDSLNALKAHAQTSTKKERGFQELKSGTLVQGNVNGDNLLEFGIGQNSLGTVHSHQPGTIGILAPQDVMTFLHIVREQDTNSLGNAYSGTVSSSGTYFINFTGTASDLPPAMTEAQEKVYVADLVKAYKEWEDVLSEDDRYSIDYLKVNKPQGLEILFFKLLKKMNLNDKVQLIKEENGNTSTIKENTNGTTTPNPC
jgi:hypothetical protein